jgi:pimeloyl-ACP methyl ester carboxylesterase
MPFLERESCRIFYETWGDVGTRWVTLINGHTRSHTDFRLFARFLVDKGYRVLSLDNRGAGKTECAPDFSVEDIAADVVALWDELGVKRSHLLGISFGGAISSTLVRDYPERVASLVLVSTAHHFAYARATAAGKQKPDMASYFSPRFAESNPLLFRALTKDTGTAYGSPERAAGTLAQQRSLQDFDSDAWLPQLRVPTLVVHGVDDRIIPMADARHLAKRIPGAKLETFEGAGHLLLAEAPRRLYETTESFFASLKAK